MGASNDKSGAGEVATPTSSLELNQVVIDGKRDFTDARKDLHRQLIIDAVDLVASVDHPVAILMAGGTASGKSSMYDHVKARHKGKDLAFVDSDRFKEGLPEYQAMKAKGGEDRAQAASFVHQESGHLVGLALIRARSKRKSFVYDSTASDAAWTGQTINELREAGYHVELYYADLPLEKAKQRERTRFEEDGRSVPEDVIESTHRGAIASFAHNFHRVHRAIIWNTDVARGKSARLAFEWDQDRGTVYKNDAHLAKMEKRGHTFMKDTRI